MRNDQLLTIKRIPRHKGGVGLVLGVFVGLVLAYFVMVSVHAAVLVFSGGIVLALVLFFRRIDLLIYGWFVLTGFVLVLSWHLIPEYSEFLGTAIFWGLLFCIIGAWAVENVLGGMKFIPFENLPIMVTTFLFLLWGTISVSTSVDPGISIRRFSHIVIGVGASYMFYDFFSRDERNIRRIVAIILVMTSVFSVATVATAVYSLVAGLPIYKQLGLWLMGSNALGSLLCHSIPIMLTAGLCLVPRKCFKVFFAVLMLLALFFSFARTAWIGTLVAVAFLIWKSRMKWPIQFAIVTCLIVIAWWFPAGGEGFFQYITGERYTGRQQIWKASWTMACDHPIFGVGPGNAMYLMSEYVADPEYARLFEVVDAHNLYLKNAAEMGFMSPVIWLALFCVFIHSSLKIEKNLDSKFLRLVCRGSTATFVGLSVHGLGENGFFMTPFVAGEYFVLLPYIIFAMPFAAKKLEERDESGAQLGS